MIGYGLLPMKGDVVTIEVCIDGSCTPNPDGIATWASIVRSGEKELWRANGIAGKGKGMTNNVAEYVALIHTLDWLSSNGYRDSEILIKSDSEMLVEQMNGTRKVRKGLYYPYYIQAKDKVQNFNYIKFIHIDREANRDADKLAERALRR